MQNEKLTIVLPDCDTISKGDLDLSSLSEFGDVITYPLTKREELPERLEEADVILCNKILLNEDSLRNATKLKYIGLFATGYNNVDLEYTNARNITVCNAGSYSTDAVAQHTFALIMNYYNKVAKCDNFVKDNGWKNSKIFSPFIYNMSELADKTIGVIGFGSIGQKVCEIAKAFNMNIIAFSRNEQNVNNIIKKKFNDYSNIRYGSINDIAKNSDIITVHCPLNNASEKMINEEFLSKCKSNCYFVNTSRGGVVDEHALCRALNNGVIAGAGIDVLTTEPMAEDCELLHAKNITITPHVAWAPLETRERLLNIVKDNLRAFINGEPQNVIRQ